MEKKVNLCFWLWWVKIQYKTLITSTDHLIYKMAWCMIMIQLLYCYHGKTISKTGGHSWFLKKFRKELSIVFMIVMIIVNERCNKYFNQTEFQISIKNSTLIEDHLKNTHDMCGFEIWQWFRRKGKKYFHLC